MARAQKGIKSLINTIEFIAEFFSLNTAETVYQKMFEFLYTLLLQEKARQNLLNTPANESLKKYRKTWNHILGKESPAIIIPESAFRTQPHEEQPNIAIQHWLSKNIEIQAALNTHQQQMNVDQAEEMTENSAETQNTLYLNKSVTLETESTESTILSLDTSVPRVFIYNTPVKKKNHDDKKAQSPFRLNFSLEFYHEPNHDQYGALPAFLNNLSNAFNAWLKNAKTNEGDRIYAHLIKINEDRHSWVHFSTKKTLMDSDLQYVKELSKNEPVYTIQKLPARLENLIGTFTKPFFAHPFQSNHNPLLSTMAIVNGRLNRPNRQIKSCEKDAEKSIVLSLSENFYFSVLQNDAAFLEPLFDKMADLFLHPEKQDPLEHKPSFYQQTREVKFYKPNPPP